MASQISLPHVCPICNSPVADDQPKCICGFDHSHWPDTPPVNLWGHRACAAGRGELIILRREP